MAESVQAEHANARSHESPADFYRNLAALPRPEIENTHLQALLRELRAGPEEQYRAILRRLRAWLHLSQPDGAIVAAAYERAVEQLSPEQQRDLFEREREAVLNGLTFREFRQLAEFVPWLRSWHVPALERPSMSAPSLPAKLLALGGGI